MPGTSAPRTRRMAWKGYAAMQSSLGRAGTTPLKNFVGNTCTSAMNSFQTVGEFGPATASGRSPARATRSTSPRSTKARGAPIQGIGSGVYYPEWSPERRGPQRGAAPIRSKVPNARLRQRRSVPQVRRERRRRRCSGPANRQIANCTVTVLDHYTSSFHWADTNFAAIWLRPFWYVLVNSALTDVQNGGLTFVTRRRLHAVIGHRRVLVRSREERLRRPHAVGHQRGSRGERRMPRRSARSTRSRAPVPDQRPVREAAATTASTPTTGSTSRSAISRPTSACSASTTARPTRTRTPISTSRRRPRSGNAVPIRPSQRLSGGN